MLHDEHCRILNQLLLRQYRNKKVLLTVPQKEEFSITFEGLNSNRETSRRQL